MYIALVIFQFHPVNKYVKEKTRVQGFKGSSVGFLFLNPRILIRFVLKRTAVTQGTIF
jgi:hypothetical protein